jgi:hypothetical protein
MCSALNVQRRNKKMKPLIARACLTSCLLAVVVAAVTAVPAAAEVVYTQVNISVPVGGYYNIDVNGDGVTDFTLGSKLLQGYCQAGDEYEWSLTAIPANGNAVVIAADHTGANYASSLTKGVPVDTSQSFSTSASLMAELYWGNCGAGTFGEWLNLPARYLGLQFQDEAKQTHYGWAEMSTAAYVDQNGHLQTSTILLGFAYETVPGQGILTGQIADGPQGTGTHRR